MNTRQIQFNQRWMVALLLASLTLALVAGLTWSGAEASGSTFQPAELAQTCAYTPPPDQMGPSAAGEDCPEAGLGKGERGLLSKLQLKIVKGGKGGVQGGDVNK